VCCHCGAVNQWAQERSWQSGCGGYFLVRCYACKSVAATIGDRSSPVRVHDLWYSEVEWPHEQHFSGTEKYGPGYKPMGNCKFDDLPIYDDSHAEFEGVEPKTGFDQSMLHGDTSGQLDDGSGVRWYPRDRNAPR